MVEEKKVPPHWTCIDTSVAGQLPYTTWACGPECLTEQFQTRTTTPGQAAFEEWAKALKTGAQWRFVDDLSKARWEGIAKAAILANCSMGKNCKHCNG